MMAEPSICLSEWEYYKPEPGTPLEGFSFGDDSAARTLVNQLAESGRLEIVELAAGLAIRSFSFVGSVQVGSLRITVQPKLTGAPLMDLLRYAYSLRRLDLYPHASSSLETFSFQDLLIHQLVNEVAELVARGLHRRYQHTKRALANPRGRIDFQEYVLGMGPAQAALPCVFFPRQENTPINRVMLAGIQLSVQLTQDLQLRGRLRRLAQLLELHVEPVPLSWVLLERATRQLDRRTATYRATFEIIRLLMEMVGITLRPGETSLKLPGFMFDMNRFFQALISRLLHENLPVYQVRDEYRLRDMIDYVENFNPRRRRAPQPRPDFVLMQDSKIVAVLDAKYRDLWEKSLPRDMLYQLAIYALSHEPNAQAIILYPTLDPAAREARLVIRDSVRGDPQASVVLRPVNLNCVADLVSARRHYRTQDERQAFAHYMAFGAQPEALIQEAVIT
jgi:5-methylcytosine-specific restriction enzyme subunit McrC